MNEKFFALVPEKQDAVINAGLHVFAAYDYRHASTDMIAKRAGISKSLLFHYFGNKKEFYLFLYDYAIRYFMDQLRGLYDHSKTDFFDILADAQLAKMELAKRYPDLSQFLIQGYLDKDIEIEASVSEQFISLVDGSKARTLERVDRTKFKDTITAEEAWNVVVWVSEGYVKGLPPDWTEDIQGVSQVFLDYLELLRRHFYREEYV